MFSCLFLPFYYSCETRETVNAAGDIPALLFMDMELITSFSPSIKNPIL